MVWIGSLVLMLWTIAFAPVQRTQEARVLVTAREMLDGHRAGVGWRAWLIPRANGEVRLQKPPLAYWMAAASFRLFGVHDWAGRLPFALCGWLTVVLTYHIALFAFDGSTRAAVWSALLLAGSFLFHRHARLAETDVVMTLVLSIAIYAIWRGSSVGERRQILWFQLSGLAIGFAAIAKGLPALCAILFLVALTLITRRWQILLRWTISGAPIIALLVGMPWWIYAHSLPHGQIVGRELNVLMDEPNHPQPVFMYVPHLIKAMAPWTAIVAIGLIDAAINWRRDLQIVARLTPLLGWCGAMFVPLLFLGNKQEHYLLPMIPPLALIGGWWLDRAATLGVQHAAGVTARWIIWLTGVALAAGAIMLPIFARLRRGDVLSIDLLAVVTSVLMACAVLWQLRRSLTAGINAFTIACAACLSFGLGYWAPSIETQSPRTVASDLRELGDGPYCFYGENVSLPLVYNLRTIIPQANDARELTRLMSEQPNLLIIAQTKGNRAPPPEPIGCETIAEIFMKDQKFEIYRSIQ